MRTFCQNRGAQSSLAWSQGRALFPTGRIEVAQVLPQVRLDPGPSRLFQSEKLKKLVPRVGFEPTAYRLRSGCSTAELPGRAERMVLAPSSVGAKPANVAPESSGKREASSGAARCSSATGRLLPGTAQAGVRQESASKAPQ